MNQSDNSYITQPVRMAKRALDIGCALIGGTLLLPVVPFIAVAIKLDSPGPIFFCQLRIGERRNDRTVLFEMVKFRTMVVDAEKHGAKWASKNDPRVTKLGKFLRKTRLDEVPQLLNVLRGDMSLVGPRPERPGFYQTLENAIPFYAERTVGVKPGITGFAQVNQGYDETIEDVRNKVSYDHAYALMLTNLRSLFRADMHIIWSTVAVVLYGRGQ